MAKRALNQTIQGRIYLELQKFEIGYTVAKSDWIKKLYGLFDPKDEHSFIRSFDVHFCKAAKLLPEMKFKSKNSIIKRIS